MHRLRTFLRMTAWGASSVLLCPGICLATDEPPSISADDLAEAKTLRDKGLELFKKKEYAQSVEFFQKALALQRTAGAMAQMASALNALGRYDEALRWYETVLVEFPKASDKLRRTVDGEMKELVAKVGTIAVEGDLIKGARLFIDNRDVGELPLQAPVRVLGGMHDVRAEKSGFTPMKTTVEVNAGKPSVAKLVAKDREAKLEIREKHNWVLHVELDGVDIGLSPLSKMVLAGEHRIRLRGYMQPDALVLCETPGEPVDLGARMESDEQVVNVGLFETQNVELSAEDMDASLHIESTPLGATLWIDGHDAGKTPWDGRLALGEHAIEVRNRGFYLSKQTVTLERRKQRELSVVLEREPDRAAEERALRNAKIGVGLAYGLGGVGLGMFAVAGGLFVSNVNALKTNCPQQQCPSTEAGRLETVDNLGTVSTLGLVVAGIGAAAGTTVFYLTRTRPEERKKPATPTMGVSVGLGGLGFQGRF